MKTQRGKGKHHPWPGDMRVVMSLLELYDACLRNADELLAEAKLLLKHDHVARAFALAYTGWEEVGKAQLVGDYTNEMVADEEFEAAFSDHKLKSAYNWRRFVLNPADLNDSTIEYERGQADEAFQKRQAALYVGKDSDFKPLSPSQRVVRKDAESVIRALETELERIRRFDAMNERVGSSSFLK